MNKLFLALLLPALALCLTAQDARAASSSPKAPAP